MVIHNFRYITWFQRSNQPPPWAMTPHEFHQKCWGKGDQFGIYNFLCCKTAKSPQKWKGHYINNVLLLSLGSLRWGEVFQDRLLHLFYFWDRISKVPIKRFRKFLKGFPLRANFDRNAKKQKINFKNCATCYTKPTRSPAPNWGFAKALYKSLRHTA